MAENIRRGAPLPHHAVQPPVRRVAILLTRGAIARAGPSDVEPGMVLEKLNKALADHSSCAEDAYGDAGGEAFVVRRSSFVVHKFVARSSWIVVRASR